MNFFEKPFPIFLGMTIDENICGVQIEIFYKTLNGSLRSHLLLEESQIALNIIANKWFMLMR